MYFKNKTETFKFRISPLFLKALDLKAKQMKCSKSECVQKLLMPYLAEFMIELRKSDNFENKKANFDN